MRESSVIRRRGDQRRNRRRAAVGMISILVVGGFAAAGTSLWTRPTASISPATPPSSTATATATPTPAESPSNSAEPTTSANASPAPGSQLSVAITGLSPATSLTIGGQEIEFAVTVTNSTPQTFRNIALNLSAGHCTCSDSRVLSLAPEGALTWQQTDGSWKAVQYVREGGGMDYISVRQVPGFALNPGASRSFTFRLRLAAVQQGTYHDGQLPIDATIIGLAGYIAVGPVKMLASPGTQGAYAMAILGDNPAASVPIQVVAH